MKNLNQDLADFSVEKLEERKEFTFYHHGHGGGHGGGCCNCGCGSNG